SLRGSNGSAAFSSAGNTTPRTSLDSFSSPALFSSSDDFEIGSNHNCNFYRLIARVLLPSTPLMTHSFASWQTRPAGKNKPSAGRGAMVMPRRSASVQHSGSTILLKETDRSFKGG